MAINYPSTTNQPTDGSFAHTAEGITWTWDGTSWKAQGITSNYVLPSATASALGGIKVGNNLSIAGDGTLAASAAVTAVDDLSDVTISTPTTGQVIKYNGSAWVNGTDDTGTTINAIDDIGDVDTTTAAPAVGEVLKWNGSAWVPGTDAIGTGLGARQTVAVQTPSAIANDQKFDMTATTAKTYALLSVEVSHAAWVTLYTSNGARFNDANRSETTDPLPGSGVVAEVITSEATVQPITPGTIGFNNDSPINSSCFIKVVNKSGASAQITVTLTYVQLEV